MNTQISLEGIPFEAVAYNFPNYHPSPNQEKYSGKGSTEWELLKRAKPMFEGHLQPKYPLWGYYNEADPAWAEQEIEAASSHGISAFAVDWYWYNGTPANCTQTHTRDVQKWTIPLNILAKVRICL